MAGFQGHETTGAVRPGHPSELSAQHSSSNFKLKVQRDASLTFGQSPLRELLPVENFLLCSLRPFLTGGFEDPALFRILAWCRFANRKRDHVERAEPSCV